ncbi:MAG: hypothetical protein COY39_03350 [Alphaproteobacteria bacterium CG_4_10_14_0_8_um_filter_37_21]|nr:MAG: hypothetical protein COY39_03350 [Alphaproteobacteria bacterium CG_4_10_14_0_8_um_filter_37_21]
MQDALTVARQSLMTARTAEGVFSRNAADMQDPNSIKKVIDYTAQGGGLIATVRESVNESLLTNSRQTLLKANELSVKHAFASQVEVQVGNVGENRSVAHQCAKLAAQFYTLSNTDRVSLANVKNTVYSELSSFIEKNKDFADAIQRERANASESITGTISLVNESLKLLASANARTLEVSEGDFSAVEQQRAALNDLSKHIDVFARLESNGNYTLYTDQSGSKRLVYGDEAASFSYDDTLVVSPTMAFNPIHLTVNGETVDVTNTLKAGRGEIAANLYVRDVFTPALQQQIDQATTQMVTEFNRIHNFGVSTDLRSTITGDGIPGFSAITGTETLAFGNTSGIVRFALIDREHKLNSGSGNVSYKDVDLSTFGGGDINAFVTFLNTELTAGGPLSNINITASITNGQFQLTTSDTSLGIAIGEQDPFGSPGVTSNLELTSGEKTSFSNFFGLNNLLTNALQPNSAGFTQQIKIRPDIVKNTGNGIAVGLLNMKMPPTTHDSALFGTHIAKELAAGLTENKMSFAITDTMDSKTSSLQEYFTSIVGNLSVMTRNFEREKTLAISSHIESTKLIETLSKTTHKEAQDNMMDLALFQQMMLKVLASSLAMRDALFDVT